MEGGFLIKTEEYFEKVYSSFWHKQVKKYGFTQYEKFALEKILQTSPRSAFEIGIGTGFPLATALQENNIQVDGCDISRTMIKEAKENLPGAELFVGELIDLSINKTYDLVYCFRTSWYIRNFYSLLKIMADMANNNGVVLFDIFTPNSTNYLKHICHRIYKRIIWLGMFILRRKIIKEPDNYFYSIRKIKNVLKDFDVEVYRQHEILNLKRKINQSKVLLVCRKKQQ